ncbi:E3 ubiquitin-protein ligase Ubr3, partial [Pseudolycoriella hygida]
AKRIMGLGKRGSAAFINDEILKCSQGSKNDNLTALLRTILDPDSNIDDTENIDWCKWIIAGGRTLSDFAATVASYDNHAKCGLVWVPHVVAYRCRTCGISPCMSICRNCFKKGDHATHDFNMFLSQAGGACDCGDTSVMKAEGFCSDHGINNSSNKSPIPKDLMAVAEAVMPQLLLRLLYHFRDSETEEHAKKCDEYIGMLMELNNMGELMRRVMTKALINPQLYAELVEPNYDEEDAFQEYMIASKHRYQAAVEEFPTPDVPAEYRELTALAESIVHSTLLEEFIFWTFKLEFPQNIVCFLLNMIPEQDYKEHLTRTFVMHYSRIPSVLELSKDPDTLSNRVVHMSVQLFSNESLALKMVRELNLLHVMVISLKMMMTKNLIENTLHDSSKNYHFVIDCSKPVMKDHCYWPLVSDFNNVLSHESVALVFLRDDKLVDMWFQFLFMLQGMNVNERETGTHVEYEPGSYYAAFSCELEASAYPMWSIISHLKDSSYTALTTNILRFCINYLQEWLDAIFLLQPKIEPREMMVASFHFPLHRYLAAFTCQAVKCMGMSLKNILPPTNLLTLLMIHPLRVQCSNTERIDSSNKWFEKSFFYEILAGIWIRNGLQIKGQAMTYIQANFCNSMVDMDLFFLQICATQLPAHTFLTTAIEVFGVKDWLGMCPLTTSHELEQDSMLEGLLTFLATLVTSRTNLGNNEQTQCIIEISALLATGDKTHSQLLELMPERSGNAHTRNFDTFLEELSNFRRPPQSSENLEQGLFIPVAAVWEKYYDPLHVLLRAIHRRDFQNSMDRFTNYVKQQNKMPKSGVLWPPFRLPRSVCANYSDPSFVLHSRVFHSTILGILYRAVHSHNISEHMLALAIFLLEVAVTTDAGNSIKDTVLECGRSPSAAHREDRDPPELLNCYPGDCLSENLRYCVPRISLASPEPQGATCANYTIFDSDVEYDISESETLPMLVGNADGIHQSSGMELAVPHDLTVGVPQDLSLVRGQSLVLHENTDDATLDEDMSPTTQSLPPITMSENDQAITEYLPDRQSELHIDTHLPMEQSTMMEVAIRRNLGPPSIQSSNNSREVFRPTANAATGMLLPFQRVQPVPVTSTNLDVVPIQTTGPPRIHSGVKSKTVESNNSLDDSIVFEESIISLLLKLHSQLSGSLDSFSLNENVSDVEDMVIDSEPGPSNREYFNQNQSNFATVTDSRIGDGPFFIGKLLHKIANLDDLCASKINEVRHRMWPNQREKQAEQKAAETREKEERSKRAKERQQKMMEDFANKQKKFMETSAEGMDCCDDEEEEVEQLREKEYVCIICNRTNPSTEHNPIGLVVLVESSGVVGHRRKTSQRLLLPLNDEDHQKPGRHVRLATEFNRRTTLLSAKFGSESWFLSNNLAYESGVHVQSCGHHVHLSCHDAYLNSLYTSQRHQNLNVERGEFLCPVCRQLSNSFLPLSPILDRPTPMIRVPSPPFRDLVTELTTLIKENERPPTSTILSEAMGRAMEDMTNSIYRKAKRRPTPTLRNLFLFVTSIARTNLEAEIIQRGGSLCSSNSIRFKPKRDCIVPLLHVLSAHVRVLTEWPLWRSWASLCGLPNDDSAPVPLLCMEYIPHLLSDPIALMLKFILLAPLHLDQVYFTCIVKVMYNLLYYQVVVQICYSLTESQCDEIMSKYSAEPMVPVTGVTNLGAAISFVLHEMLTKSSLLRCDSGDDQSNRPIDVNALELQVQELCLPFLRVASLLKHHLYHHELPEIALSDLEYSGLVSYLELIADTVQQGSFNAAMALCFLEGTERSLPKYWCYQLLEVQPPHEQTRELILYQHISWQQPRLLGLPREYEQLFTYYHEKSCSKCNTIPKESSICLLCGTIVCLKQLCCEEEKCCEAVRHTITCGGGAGIFLVVTSTYTIVIRGRRACLWGSLYLDEFDEEDRDLNVSSIRHEKNLDDENLKFTPNSCGCEDLIKYICGLCRRCISIVQILLS